MTELLRVLIADDHALFREGIRQVLTSGTGFEIVGEAGNGTEALALIEQHHPDVALLDISMPGATGLEVAAILKQRRDPCKVVILSVHDHAEYVREAVRSGARSYLRKDTSPVELREAIRAVARGEEYFSPSVAGRLADAMRNEHERGEQVVRLEGLTPREREVLTGIVNGDTNREIGATLGISTRTVETHRESVMRKLNIRSVAGLTRFAVSCGLIKTSPESDTP
ncbi:MAG: response regulator transcription factor [Gemmatimonadota bacterium]